MASDDTSIWMPIYWSDWMRDTAMLSLQEQGAYFMLIKEYWNNGGALPDDKTRIYRSCGSQSRSEKESVNLILETYFKHENGVYHHGRIESEVAKALGNKEEQRKRTEAARAARAVKTETVTETVTESPSPSPSPSPTVPDGTVTEAKASLFAKPLLVNSSSVEVIGGYARAENLPAVIVDPPPKRIKPAYTPEFEAFWAEMPPTGGSKAKAAESYEKAIKSGVSHETLHEKAREFAAYHAQPLPPSGFREHPCAPAVWLNQHRWETDYVAAHHAAHNRPQAVGRFVAAATSIFEDEGRGSISGFAGGSDRPRIPSGHP